MIYAVRVHWVIPLVFFLTVPLLGILSSVSSNFGTRCSPHSSLGQSMVVSSPDSAISPV